MILLLGNCQLDRLLHIIRLNHAGDVDYVSNIEHVLPGPESSAILDSLGRYELVIAQPVFNEHNPMHFRTIRALAREVIFAPYIFVDGIFSLSEADVGSGIFYGEERLDPRYFEADVGTVLQDFLMGRIDFANQQRLRGSLQELQRREAEAGAIVISDHLISGLADTELMLTHNHPKPVLMDVLAARVFAAAGLPYRKLEILQPHERVEYSFGLAPRVLSPYDVAALGLRYPPDEQWWPIGSNIIRRIWEKHNPSSRAS